MSKATKKDRANKPLPLPGFLRLFIVTLVLGALYNVFNGLGEAGDISKFSSLRATYPGLHAMLVAEAAMFILFALLGVFVIVLLVKRLGIARAAAIVFLTVTAAWSLADILIARHIFANSGNDFGTEVRSSMQIFFRTAVYDIIWSLYLIRSKKTKGILTKKSEAFERVKAYVLSQYTNEP